MTKVKGMTYTEKDPHLIVTMGLSSTPVMEAIKNFSPDSITLVYDRLYKSRKSELTRKEKKYLDEIDRALDEIEEYIKNEFMHQPEKLPVDTSDFWNVYISLSDLIKKYSDRKMIMVIAGGPQNLVTAAYLVAYRYTIEAWIYSSGIYRQLPVIIDERITERWKKLTDEVLNSIKKITPLEEFLRKISKKLGVNESVVHSILIEAKTRSEVVIWKEETDGNVVYYVERKIKEEKPRKRRGRPRKKKSEFDLL